MSAPSGFGVVFSLLFFLLQSKQTFSHFWASGARHNSTTFTQTHPPEISGRLRKAEWNTVKNLNVLRPSVRSLEIETSSSRVIGSKTRTLAYNFVPWLGNWRVTTQNLIGQNRKSIELWGIKCDTVITFIHQSTLDEEKNWKRKIDFLTFFSTPCLFRKWTITALHNFLFE